MAVDAKLSVSLEEGMQLKQALVSSQQEEEQLRRQAAANAAEALKLIQVCSSPRFQATARAYIRLFRRAA